MPNQSINRGEGSGLVGKEFIRNIFCALSFIGILFVSYKNDLVGRVCSIPCNIGNDDNICKENIAPKSVKSYGI